MTFSPSRARRLVLVLLLAVGLGQAAREIKPGWNLFSKEQDIEMGKEASKDVEKEVQVVNDATLTNYISGIGKRLAANSQAPDYPYSFKVVADENINAFALPGGPIYVNSGTIAAADNEAQLAGVMAHEIGHVALRHSTQQASKAQAWQIPLAIASGALGSSGGLLSGLAQLGISFGVNSLFLKYSRDAEKQADIVGTHTMAQTGYDPVEMARFFEKLQSQAGGAGGGAAQFFSDHPNPGNRVAYVTEEVRQMPPGHYTTGSADFPKMKERASKIKPSKTKAQPNQQSGSASSSAPPPQGFESFRGQDYELAYPQPWQVYAARDGSSVTIAPQNGIVKQQDGGTGIARGILAGYFKPTNTALSQAADDLIADLRQSNPDLQPLRGQRRSMKVDGQPAEAVLLDGPSATNNGRELVWLVATQRPEGLFYVLMIAPQDEYDGLRGQYETVANSIHFAAQQASR